MTIAMFERAVPSQVRRLSAGLTLALSMCLVTPAPAANPQPLKRTLPGVLENWVDRLRGISGDLKAAEWKKAKRACDFLLAEMRESIEGGASSGGLLAMASLYRALAEAGLGDEREAAWDFRMAQALYPDYARVDLSPYGEAGLRLEAHRVRPPGTPLPAGEDAKDQPLPPMRGIHPPERIRAPQPVFPFAKFNACIDGRVMILTVIDREGRVKDPSILAAEDPVLAFSAMDAARAWKFRPARLKANNTPVPVIYTLTVNYKLSACDNPFARAAGRN
ncbi:MAG: energy transducer TonB [Thermoanaerobaculia bacterium]|nr:energy transducer TonB [Thermoanaerobaculia bacterium]